MWLIAVLLNSIHLVYFISTTTIDLFPFNNIRSYTRRQRIIEVSINGILMALPIVALLLNTKGWLLGASIILALILVGEYLSWWQHYFFKPTEKWEVLYNSIFKDTIKVLPPIRNNPIPNLEHTILHSITLFSFIITVIYLFQHF